MHCCRAEGAVSSSGGGGGSSSGGGGGSGNGGGGSGNSGGGGSGKGDEANQALTKKFKEKDLSKHRGIILMDDKSEPLFQVMIMFVCVRPAFCSRF